MKIICIGGGAAGLYFAISMKLRDPSHEVVVVERNRPGDTFGWGVVFSDQTMDNLGANDPESAAEVFDNFAHWDDIDVHFKGEVAFGFLCLVMTFRRTMSRYTMKTALGSTSKRPTRA